MRLLSFGPAGQERPGVLLDDERILDLALASAGEIPSLRHLFVQGDVGLRKVAEWIVAEHPEEHIVSIQNVRLGPPLTNPSKIVCLGLNYRCHAEEQNARIPANPLLFAKAVTSLAGQGDSIWIPAGEEHLDYEVELAMIIGRTAFRVDPKEWESYVVGYTVLNDVSSRDAQRADKKWFRGKSCDSSCPMGPWIVTRDEIPRPDALRLTTTLNGELRQDGTTSDLLFPIPETLAFVSRNTTLVPGDIISTGTPKGVGIFRDPPACMNAGDEVVVSVEQIGTLTNPVQERPDNRPSPYPTFP
jgi:2,4-didehydro-3-deoxy-L-rhamnonate hydrolase